MKPRAWLVLALLAWSATAPAAEPLSPRRANYVIEARLDPAAHTVTATQIIEWKNDTASPASDLYFHLYLNAFANNRTTMMRELVRAHGPGVLDDWDEGWGQITIDSIVVGGEERVGALEAAYPDDPNPDDRTVVRLPLTQAVAPGGRLRADLRFTTRLPKLLLRSGYSGDFHFVAQWFPKLGVFQDGKWNCHQYHANSEFFADFGVYDVSLTVPAGWTVGASGVRHEVRDGADGTRTYRYLAEDVHDFAWVADPNLIEQRERAGHVEVLVLCSPRDCREADRFFDPIREGFAWFEEHIGAYPYPQLTVVVPPPFASDAGGMEYPTLITGIAPRWIPRFLRLPEVVAVHELGHQYWYGMVANNEFEEAWLDEGINSYTEDAILQRMYGKGSVLDLPSLRIDAIALRRGMFMDRGGRDPSTLASWEFLDSGSYAAATYDQTALTLETLEGYHGEAAVLAGLRFFFERGRFRHPGAADFYAAMSDAAGTDLKPFFDQTLRSSDRIDYATTEVSVATLEPLAGLGVQAQPAAATDTYQSTVVVERLGGAALPVDVTVIFDDGSETREQWDGQSRWRRFEYTGTQGVGHAVLDPKGALALDIDPLNNSRMREGGTRGLVRLGLRWGFWFQSLLHVLTSF